jgi:hypothetical protein
VAGKVTYTDVYSERGEKMGVIEYATKEDMEEALYSLDGRDLHKSRVKLYKVNVSDCEVVSSGLFGRHGPQRKETVVNRVGIQLGQSSDRYRLSTGRNWQPGGIDGGARSSLLAHACFHSCSVRCAWAWIACLFVCGARELRPAA